MSKAKNTNIPLPNFLPVPTVEEIQTRLNEIFPESFPNRGLLVGQMSARVIFVFIYGGFVGDNGRYFRPSHVYRFTEEQSRKTSVEDRCEWINKCIRPGYIPDGNRWYQDNTRESIRDDLMRNQYDRIGIIGKSINSEHSTTSSKPVAFLHENFAQLFSPEIIGESLEELINNWRIANLDAASLKRMALRSKGIDAKDSDTFVNLPDGQRIRIASGLSNQIVKALVENFAPLYLKKPAVIWISASDKKSYPAFVELAGSIGLKFDLNAELPDLILADTSNPMKIIMCEVVASDGPVSEKRKEDLLKIIAESEIPRENVEFLTAFDDREVQPFRKNFSKIALDTMIWFRTEPNLLVKMSDLQDK